MVTVVRGARIVFWGVPVARVTGYISPVTLESLGDKNGNASELGQHRVGSGVLLVVEHHTMFYCYYHHHHHHHHSTLYTSTVCLCGCFTLLGRTCGSCHWVHWPRYFRVTRIHECLRVCSAVQCSAAAGASEGGESTCAGAYFGSCQSALAPLL